MLSSSTLDGQIRFQKSGVRCSPFYRAFFRSIDLGQFVYAIKETLHVVHQECLGFRVGNIQAVMINDASLGLEPLSPTWLADFVGDFLSQVGRQGSKSKRRSLLPTAGTFDRV